MPILEAMACGTPSLVPRFGACLDYCSEATSFLVEAQQIRLPLDTEFVYNSLGFKEQVQQVNFCEVSVAELARVMRQVYDAHQMDRAAIRQRAENGARVAHERFTWDHTVAHVERALRALAQHKTPVRMLHQRRANEQAHLIYQRARDLYLGLPNAAALSVRSP